MNNRQIELRDIIVNNIIEEFEDDGIEDVIGGIVSASIALIEAAGVKDIEFAGWKLTKIEEE